VVNDAVEVAEGGADCVGAVVVEVAAGTVPPSPEVVEKARHLDGVLQLHTYLS
jgi:hypothetical protein